MNIEEKAKAYDMAIERAKEYLKEYYFEEAVKNIFPELAENEDEEVRKALVDLVKCNERSGYTLLNNVSTSSMLAWLERQGNNINCIYDKELSELLHIVICRYINDSNISYPERENVSKKILPYVELLEKQGESYTKRDVDNAYLEGMAFAKDELEKQAEVESDNDDIEVEEKGIREAFNKIEDEKQCKQKSQRMISAEAKEAMYNKPADTVEPKCEESKTKIFDAPTPFEDKLYAFVAACEFLMLPAKIEFIKEHSQELLDAAKEQIEKEETEWTKEDERLLNNMVIVIQDYYNKEDAQSLISWLKSLKDRAQPKQKWSEEDENRLSDAIFFVREYQIPTRDKRLLNAAKETEDWLKSLRPQNNITDEELAQAKKDAYNDALDKIEYHSGEPTFGDGWSAAIWYLKKRNVMPQTQWKPSDEQMEVLLSEVTGWKKGCPKQIVLESLYNDLKKLKNNKDMETRYCIEYVNPRHPLRDNGSINVRYDRALTLEQAEHDLTLILSFGGKILDLYMGNVVDGETGEWSPKPMIVDDDDWFTTDWLKSLRPQPKQEWSEEDEKMLADAYIMLDWYKGNNWWAAQYIKDWLKSLKQRIGG